jgi:phosphomevalonate kinase
VQHFHDSPNYTKAHVSTHRSINGLVEKRLVYAFSTFQEYSLQIHLTNAGIKKAADLLNISDYMSFFER